MWHCCFGLLLRHNAVNKKGLRMIDELQNPTDNKGYMPLKRYIDLTLSSTVLKLQIFKR